MGGLNYRFSIFVICFLCFVRSEEILPSYNAEGQCGNTISRTQTAGVIRYESPINYFTDCLITVSPKRLSAGPGKVMLYFTEFDLPSPCSSISVEVLDGNDPRFASPVKGLPKTLCDRNTTLVQTGMVFYTTGPTFALLIRRNVFGTQATGNFVLKFTSYSEGPCPDIDSVTTCESGLCTPTEFHCHSDIDTCGCSEKEMREEEDSDSVWETIEKIIGITISGIIFTIFFILCICIVIGSVKCPNFMRRFADGVRSKVSSLSALRLPRPQSRSERGAVRLQTRSDKAVSSPTRQNTTIEIDLELSNSDRDTESGSCAHTSSNGISSPPWVTFDDDSDCIRLSNISVSNLPQSRDLNDSVGVRYYYAASGPRPSTPPAVPEAVGVNHSYKASAPRPSTPPAVTEAVGVRHYYAASAPRPSTPPAVPYHNSSSTDHGDHDCGGDF